MHSGKGHQKLNGSKRLGGKDDAIQKEETTNGKEGGKKKKGYRDIENISTRAVPCQWKYFQQGGKRNNKGTKILKRHGGGKGYW